MNLPRVKIGKEFGGCGELTDHFILAIAPRATEAAFAHTLEALRRRRGLKDRPPLRSESKWVRATLAEYMENSGPPKYDEAIA